MGLIVADKADSQDICFVPSGGYADVIERLRPGAATPGDVVHIDGRVLGRHEGIIRYTVGQRRGLGLAVGVPLYVVGLDADSHRVVVGPKNALETHRVILREVNWLGDQPLSQAVADGAEVYARVRSTRPPVPAQLHQEDGRLVVELLTPESGVAPGQACVFYEAPDGGSRVLGGGVIDRAPTAGSRAAAAAGTMACVT